MMLPYVVFFYPDGSLDIFSCFTGVAGVVGDEEDGWGRGLRGSGRKGKGGGRDD